jgi:pyridoxal phosphate enzyme (YggS family)
MAAAGLTAVQGRIEAAAARSGRDSTDVVLVAVSKGRSRDQILEVYDAGHRDFGENRAEELAEKASSLPDDIVWHFIGSIQSRKTKLIVPHAHWIHSIDREKIATSVATLQGDNRPRCLIQVNVAGEEQKHGAGPDDAGGLIDVAVDAGLDVGGLMLIPPLPEVPEDSRRWYRSLVELRDALATPVTPLRTLSMGMTDDFEVAVEEGATVLRVGRAIFDV